MAFNSEIPAAFLKDTGKEIAKVESLPRRSSRMLVRLLAEKREQRSVQKAFQRCLAFARFSARPGQEGNSKECNFPRMYFVLSFIVSTMNFLVKADYEERGARSISGKRSYSSTRSVNFHDRSNLFPTFILSSPSFPENSRHEPNIRRDTRDEVNNLLSHLSLPLFGIIIPNSKLERGFSLLNSFHGISYSKTASIPRLGVLPGRTLEPRHLESNINATRTTKRDKFGIISIREEEAGLLRRLRLLSRGD